MNLTDLQEVRKRWKDIPLEVVPKDKVEVFKQRKQAVDMYIDGFTLKEIEEETGIYASRIFPLVKRCMQFDADGNFYGYTALLPGIKIDEMGNSVPHEFGKLLQRYPALADFIEGNWFGNAKYTRKKNMSLAMLHEMFLDEAVKGRSDDTEILDFSNFKDNGNYTLARSIHTFATIPYRSLPFWGFKKNKIFIDCAEDMFWYQWDQYKNLYTSKNRISDNYTWMGLDPISYIIIERHDKRFDGYRVIGKKYIQQV